MWCLQHTYIHPLNGPLSVTTQVSRYQKGDAYNKVVLITILIIKKATVSNSQNVKDSSHANKYLKKNKKLK